MLYTNDNGKISLACTRHARLRGLLGRDCFEGVMLLAPCTDVHTIGMRMPIDVAFVGPTGVVLKSCRNVGPRRRIACRGASAVMERKASPDEPWPRKGSSIVMGFEPVLKHK